ncbi:hypothetical protein J1N35_007481 [Gossypium stocksii]|uniref:Uncharacterized protein n=1 Tax=Gossypium stocksii TaxID=47602 RepID=A0A9D4AFL7_9ROSI|nr:hypothetical protein J1N35_007481 [Gossypium stocksii]
MGSNAKLPYFQIKGLLIDGFSKNDPIELPIGPMTRTRAKRLKEALSGLIQQIRAERQKPKLCWAPKDIPSPSNVLHIVYKV